MLAKSEGVICETEIMSEVLYIADLYAVLCNF
jgi:hypothetical protein